MSGRGDFLRIVIAGASLLRGKELKLALGESSLAAAELGLLDEEFAAGTLTEAAGEPAVIETVGDDSFLGARIVFFTGSPAFAARHASAAEQAGAMVIDLSGGLAAENGAQTWIPRLEAILRPPEGMAGNRKRNIIVAPSAPSIVAVTLSAALTALGLQRLAITFLQPVSERGQEGVEELEAQVVKLLSFEPFTKEVFDEQVGFNLLARFGEASRELLADARTLIEKEMHAYLQGRAALPAIMLVQAPVFYAHTFSAWAEFASPPDLAELTERLESAGLKIAGEEDMPPSNVSVAGEAQPVLARPERDAGVTNGVWLWGAADNLRVPVANAIAIAERLLAS